MNKIDLIIDTIYELMYSNSTAVAADKYLAALNAANELKALKPVAWMYKGNFHDFDPSEWASPEFVVTPLYTAPPRKPWVSLSDDEMESLVTQAREVPVEIPCDSFTTRLLKLAEKILKDKNT
jgi:hypothetical protein